MTECVQYEQIRELLGMVGGFVIAIVIVWKLL